MRPSSCPSRGLRSNRNEVRFPLVPGEQLHVGMCRCLEKPHFECSFSVQVVLPHSRMCICRFSSTQPRALDGCIHVSWVANSLMGAKRCTPTGPVFVTIMRSAMCFVAVRDTATFETEDQQFGRNCFTAERVVCASWRKTLDISGSAGRLLCQCPECPVPEAPVRSPSLVDIGADQVFLRAVLPDEQGLAGSGSMSKARTARTLVMELL
jgi:hypothetical protein